MEIALAIATILGGLAAADQLLARLKRGTYRSVWNRIRSAATIRSRYGSDQIAGIRWEWTWGKRGVENLTPFCPRCSCQLDLKAEDTGYHPLVVYHDGGPPKPRFTDILCSSCGFSTRLEPEPGRFRKEVKREIERRKRTGANKKAA